MPPPDKTPTTGGDDAFVPLPLPEDVAPSDGAGVDGGGEQIFTEDNPNGGDGAMLPASEADHLDKNYGKSHQLGGALSTVGDVAQGAAGGIEKGVKETAKFAEGIASGRMLMPKDMQESAGGKKIAEQQAADSKAIDSIPQVPAPETAAGHIAEGISQFSVGMLGITKFNQAAGLFRGASKLLKFGRVMAEGGVAQAVAFDPHEDRLSNMVESFSEEYPSLATPISEYLAAKPEDTEAEGRLKNFLEGATMTAAAETLLAGVRGLKKIRAARAQGGDEAAAKASSEVADELETVQVKPQEQTTPLSAEEPIPPQATEEVKPVPPEPVAAEAIAQADADSIIKELTDGADYPVDRQTGLLNHTKIDGPGSMRQVLELTAEKVAPFIAKKTGGVQTWAETQNLAELFDATPDELWANLSKLSKDTNKQAAMVFAAREQMNGLATAIYHEARALDNGVRTDRGGINAMVQKLAEMEKIILPIRTAQARGTRQWGMSADMAISSMQLKAIIASGGDLKALTSAVKVPSVARRALDAYTEYWVNAILSGPKTHVVNITSNFIQSATRPLEKAIGGDLMAGFDTFVGQAKAIKDSISYASKAFRAEESILDPRLMKTEGARHAISAGNLGMNPKSTMGAMTNFVGKVVRLPTRMLLSADEFFKQLNYRGNLYAQVTREGTAKGLKGSDLAKYMEDRFQKAFDKTGAGLDDAALHEARLATFTEDLQKGSFSETVTNSINAKHPWARLILPFIRTPTNIIKEVGWHTPGVNLTLKSYRAELTAGGSRAAAARGMWATGGVLWSGAGLLAAQGMLTGRGPADVNEKNAKLATGWRPYSLKVGDTYYDYSRLDPFGMVLGLAADFTEAHGYMDEKSKSDMALAMGAALMRNLTSKTYFRGLADILDAATQPDKKFAHFWNNRVGSHVPTAFNQVAGLVGAGDDTMREVRSAMDAIYARTPGLSETLAPRRNLLGEPIHYPPAFGPDSVSPFAMSKDLGDSVKAELARLSFGFKMPSEKIGHAGNIDLTKYKNEKGQDAYDRLLELRSIERKGRYTLKEKLANEIESQRYQDLPDGTDEYSSLKLKRVQAILGEYHEATMKRLRKEYPSLDSDIRTDDHNAKSVQRKGPGSLQALLGN